MGKNEVNNCIEVRKALQGYADPVRAQSSQRFFKTGPGEYGEGDVFIGVTVPQQRLVAKSYMHLSLSEIEKLLHSKIHEQRLTALIILCTQYKKADIVAQKKIYDLYLANTELINNWDLVDLSAPNIVGEYLLDKDRTVLLNLAKSQSIWERRIAMLTCFTFIKYGETKNAFSIAEILVNDEHDLIQKAVGWMLREAGNRCGIAAEEEFLQAHYITMPRTALRYAIERFPEKKRQAYLKGNA